MKTFTFLLIILTSAAVYSQGNFTLEWTSPVNEDFYTFSSTESNNNICEVITATSTQYKVYDGATHSLKRTYNIPLDSSYIQFPFYLEPYYTRFDVNNDGLFELFQVKDAWMQGNSYIKVLNAANGNVLFTYNYSPESFPGYYIFDIDGDSYIELIVADYIGGKNIIKVFSTPAPIGIVQIGEPVNQFQLKQNYPNPFNPSTSIEYTLPKTSNVRLVIYNELGQLIKVLVDQKQNLGSYKIQTGDLGFSSGVYFYQITIDGLSLAKKMVVIK